MDGYNLGTGALFLMGGLYPRTSAAASGKWLAVVLVPEGASQLMDNDNSRYPVEFRRAVKLSVGSQAHLGDRLKIILWASNFSSVPARMPSTE